VDISLALLRDGALIGVEGLCVLLCALKAIRHTIHADTHTLVVDAAVHALLFSVTALS
jgi:hypothetical protein